MKVQTIIIVMLGILILLAIGILLKPDVSSKITGNIISEQVEQQTFDFPLNAFVSKVIDGDTVIIAGESVRLLGMDTDERGYPCYNEAKKRIEELILDKEVVLEQDAEDKDMYERRLRYIFLNGENINLQLVKEGLAVARFYPENQKYKEEILEAELYARENKLGCKWREVEESVVVEKESEGKEQKESSEEKSTEYDCSSNMYNCGDFKTHAEAQAIFEACGGVSNDVHLLDKDKDGDACETLG